MAPTDSPRDGRTALMRRATPPHQIGSVSRPNLALRYVDLCQALADMFGKWWPALAATIVLMWSGAVFALTYSWPYVSEHMPPLVAVIQENPAPQPSKQPVTASPTPSNTGGWRPRPSASPSRSTPNPQLSPKPSPSPTGPAGPSVSPEPVASPTAAPASTNPITPGEGEQEPVVDPVVNPDPVQEP